ncbi:penicillin-binding protein activator LpoB [Desulfobotulus sp. H1]|uniref:Penicillin-binding protein activator LpoB n=1 Tax=Desulfobotulus pelophilus TaxID=2823377 RepID=A0ABT3N989_9BACT|nr:penicillin-binding protein activator LpoB [Desulfobotulus pelophilus]MCW7753736.1 penicillin-binding protein activator LpoB [Desulfobotulus pelophilus]
MIRSFFFPVTLLVAWALFTAGCAGTTVQRVDPTEEIALTDRWNATDSRLVSEEMIDDMLSFPWISRWQTGNPRNPQPTVLVMGVRNRSHEHIAVDTFVNDLRRAMIRSGKVDFVAGGDMRDAIRAERLDQEFQATPETAAAIAQETGANFALSGSIDSFVDQVDGRRVTSYQIDLRLIDMTTNREVWSGQKKIQKFQQKSRLRF